MERTMDSIGSDFDVEVPKTGHLEVDHSRSFSVREGSTHSNLRATSTGSTRARDEAGRECVIDVQSVTKTYSIAHKDPPSTLAEAMIKKARHIGHRKAKESFKALNGVSFRVFEGDAVGIVGRNGAGKSTLLKTLTRITAPTDGKIDIRGRIGSLLEVGTGFHPELTGRENVYLNGSILGMRKHEIDAAFEGIIDFSGVEKFLDTPVKRFSSGMYVRLAFAVAAHLPSEILLIDEVLAVGDATFKERSLAKMKSVTDDGRTILFVSHHLPSVAELCNRVIVLDAGRVVFDGATSEGLRHYRDLLAAGPKKELKRKDAEGPFLARFEPTCPFFSPAEDKVFDFTVEMSESIDSMAISARVMNEDDVELVGCDSSMLEKFVEYSPNGVSGQLRIRSPWLKPGKYTMDVVLYNANVRTYDQRAAEFLVTDELPYAGVPYEFTFREKAVLADFDWLIR